MKWKNSYNYFVIAVLTLLIYGQSIGYKFNMDDELVTVGNERVEKGFDGIKEILKGYYYEDDMGYKYGYRPVSQITFAIEYQLFGENPHFSHFVNVALYIFICSLIFYFLSAYIQFPNKWIPLLITLLFLVHPLHVEAVASIKNREELLAFLFPLLGLIIAMKAIDSKKWYLFLLVALCNFLAIYSKQSSLALIISLPFLAVLLRRLTLVNLLMLALSSFPFFLLAVKGSNDSKPMFLLLLVVLSLFIFVSFFYYDFSKNIKFKVKVLNSVSLLIAIVLLSLLLFFYGYNYYFLLALIPLFLMQKNKEDLYIKIAFLFPIFLSFFQFHLVWHLFLFALLVYKLNFINFQFEKIKKEWIFIAFILALSLYFSILNQHLEFRFIPFVAYLLFQFLPEHYKRYSRYYLFVIPIILSILLFSTSTVVDEGSALLLSILLLFIAFFNKEVKQLSVAKIVTVAYLILIPLFIYDFTPFPFELSSFQVTEHGALINPNYQHQNASYSSRVIDLTENPYWYFDSQFIKNGQSVSSMLFYFKKVLIPYTSSSYYGYNVLKPILSPLNQFFILFGLIVVGAFLTYFFRKEKIVLWSIFLSVITLVSISNIYEVIPGIVADRLAFTLILPVFIIIVSLFFKVIKNEKINYSIIGIWLLVLITLSFFRVQKWESPYKLFSEDVKNYPQSAKLHSLLANTIMQNETSKQTGIDKKEVEKAKLHLEQALNIYPDFFNSHYDLARVDEILKLNNEAIEHYNYVIEKDSTFYDAYLSLADLYLQQGNKSETINNLRKYLQYAGYNVDLYFNLSSLEYEVGNYEEVITINKEIIQNNPQIPEAYLNIAYAYGKLSNIEMLRKYLELGEKLAPNHGDAKIIRQEFLTK